MSVPHGDGHGDEGTVTTMAGSAWNPGWTRARGAVAGHMASRVQWATAAEIAEGAGVDVATARAALRVLRDAGLVEHRASRPDVWVLAGGSSAAKCVAEMLGLPQAAAQNLRGRLVDAADRRAAARSVGGRW